MLLLLLSFSFLSSCLLFCLFEDAAKAEEKAEKKAAAKERKAKKQEEAPMIQNQAASTTLGDIDALAALKQQLEGKK